MMLAHKKGYALLVVLLTLLILSTCATLLNQTHIFLERQHRLLKNTHRLFWITEQARQTIGKTLNENSLLSCPINTSNPQATYYVQQARAKNTQSACVFFEPETKKSAFCWIEFLQHISCVQSIASPKNAALYRITCAAYEDNFPAIITQSVISIAHASIKNCTQTIELPFGWLSFTQA